LILLAFLFCACNPTLYSTVQYARLSVNTTTVGAQEADETNGAFFEEQSELVAQASYDQYVQPVADELGFGDEENVCEMDATLPEVDAQIKDACDLGYAHWCVDVKNLWEAHCMRTCIVGTIKDSLRVGEGVVDSLQYIQEQYSADSTFKALRDEHKLKWTDYLKEFKTWFQKAVKVFGALVHLLHDADIELPDALYTVTDVSGNFATIPDNDEIPVCECPKYPTDSDCDEAVKLLED